MTCKGVSVANFKVYFPECSQKIIKKLRIARLLAEVPAG
jgi:hypothetical protein